jgi:hypothetical protein
VLEEAVMPKCTQEERDEAVVSISNECAQTVTSDHSKDYLSSGTEGCNKECVRSGAMIPCDGLQLKHNNISVIDGVSVKFILGTDKRVLVNCKIPGVRLGYVKICGVKMKMQQSSL